MDNRLREITELGQAVWIDDLTRQLLDDGGLQRLIDEDGLTGVTSNPTIFQKAMGDSDRYDTALRRVLEEAHDAREVFFRLAYEDVRDAADLLLAIFDATDGRDGYVSFELPPELAHNVEGSVSEALRFREEIGRENVLVKVPGTDEGVRAFEELTAQGVSVNVTLLFAVSRYRQIAQAYLDGLERRLAEGQPIDRIASVASFFVSRVDSKVDHDLDMLGRSDLKGRAGIANAKIAYEAFMTIFSGHRWEVLRERGANVQRPLWASTSTKDPAYPDTLYIDGLIGPDTVNTMPTATLDAARDHATAELTLTRDVAGAHHALDEIQAAGVDFDDIVEHQLIDEGVDAFAQSFDTLIDQIGSKITEMAPDGPAEHRPQQS